MREISGLAWWRKDHIAMVQDEKGEVFIFDISRKKITGSMDFDKNGDYESVASDGEHLYAVRSDGRVDRLHGGSGKKVDHWKTGLTRRNDVEGSCWDVRRERLLMACKADPGSGLDARVQRAVYAFDPVTGELDPDPALVVHLDSIKVALAKRGLMTKGMRFAPSAIAIHPTTGNYWLLSAHDRMIVVLNGTGNVIDATYLERALFPQPEGLDLDPDGLLLISSEGRGGAGRLLVYEPIAN
ncbi:MAG: SdiA-regulated domain-containing protein [Flavobacteriales bacterium]|nr:SdiA-regulated domain-containing protein [Flavobacteriales bacterium]